MGSFSHDPLDGAADVTTDADIDVDTDIGSALQTYGYGASIIGSTIGQPGWYQYFDLPMDGEDGYEEITTPVIATANGLFSAGGAVACLMFMFTGDYLGRLRNIQLGCLLGLLGGTLQGAAQNMESVSNPRQGTKKVDTNRANSRLTVLPLRT